MDSQFRTRVFLPLMMPLAILAFIAVVVGLFALILLYNTRESALVLALVAASGVLFAVSMASLRDRLDTAQRGIVGAAAAVPVLLGGLFALGVGGVPAEELNINREPHIVAAQLEGSQATVTATEFAFDPDSGTLDAGEVEWVLVNEGAALHNVQIEGLEDDFIVEANGGDTATGSLALEPGDYVFYCSVPGHRSSGMEGTFTVT